MTSDTAQDVTPPVVRRDLLPDLLRAWALIGIVLVNVEVFSSSMVLGYTDAQKADALSNGLHLGVLSLFVLKSYSLFSLMFGAGLGYQIGAAERRGENFTGNYFRRLAGLLLLGLLHVTLLFVGDILVTYAVLGVILFLCRNLRPRDLVIWGIVLNVLQFLILLALAGLFFVLANIPDEAVRMEIAMKMAAEMETYEAVDAVFRDGGFLDVVMARIRLLPDVYTGIPIMQGIAALGFFFFGLAFFKTGLLQRLEHKFWWWSRWVFLPIGVVGSVAGAVLYDAAPNRQDAILFLAMAIMVAASPFSTFGYAGWLAKIAEVAGGPILRFFARGGSATLTAYLMQSVILAFVFLEYGLGLYGEISAGQAILLALATGVFTLSFTSIWLLYFKRGPMEILLRRWTYLGQGEVLSRQ